MGVMADDLIAGWLAAARGRVFAVVAHLGLMGVMSAPRSSTALRRRAGCSPPPKAAPAA
jgi:hypothetical protein